MCFGFTMKTKHRWPKRFPKLEEMRSLLHFRPIAVQSPSCVRLFSAPFWTAAHQACPSPSPKVCPSSCPLHWWCHLVISSSDALFSFCPQSLGYYPTLFYFSCSSCSNSGSWELFLCPFDMCPSLCVLILPNFLALNDVPGSSCIFTLQT